MALNYHIAKEDILICQKRILKRKSFLFKPYVFIIPLVVATIFMFDKNYKVIIDTHFIIQWIIYFLLLVGIVYLIRNGVQNGIKKLISLNPGITGEQGIAVYNDKVVLSSENSFTEFKIPAIKSVEEVEDYYIIDTFHLRTIVLPKKAEGMEQLIKELKDIL
jgi:hypothetical protein